MFSSVARISRSFSRSWSILYKEHLGALAYGSIPPGADLRIDSLVHMHQGRKSYLAAISYIVSKDAPGC
jgi:hypothetical protein